jgi:hypothetical protein
MFPLESGGSTPGSLTVLTFISGKDFSWRTPEEINLLSSHWIRVSERILTQLKDLEKTEKKDRLELVKSIHFVLRALEMSLLGWKQWVNSPDIMVNFTKQDLEDMNQRMTDFALSFIEFDIEITQLGVKKGLKTEKKVRKKREKKPRTSYVA